MASVVGGGIVLGGGRFIVPADFANRSMVGVGLVDDFQQPVLVEWHGLAIRMAQYLVGIGIVFAIDGGLVFIGAAIARAFVAIAYPTKYL